MNSKEGLWKNNIFVCIVAFICCFLWGSAFPCIKIGYEVFQIASDDLGSRLVFAGVRFFMAGLLVIIFGSILNKNVLIPKKESKFPIFVLMMFQTILQYFFFYGGLASASGVSSSIITASSKFITILMAVFLFHYEKLTPRKVIGCIVGFLGVLMIQLPGAELNMGFKLTGEGFILISSISSSLAACFIKLYGKKESPVTLSGYQFFFGGLVMAIVGKLMGGRLDATTNLAWLLLLYMAGISSVAYTLWGLLLKYNSVSKISIFGFMNPVLGVILSAIILGEQNQAFSIWGIMSMILVTLGIVIVFRKADKQVA
ncbi:MAG: DMT family transporter [Butyrivibrio sp.]|nr:DMT family transporter [Butyrivibrio sp.]